MAVVSARVYSQRGIYMSVCGWIEGLKLQISPGIIYLWYNLCNHQNTPHI